MKKILIASYTYVVLSVIAGPAILALDAHLFPRVACFDIDPIVTRSGNQPPINETLSQYAHSLLFQAVSAGTMIIAGVILLTLLRKANIKPSSASYILSISLVVCMILGYGLIIAMATFLNICVGNI